MTAFQRISQRFRNAVGRDAWCPGMLLLACLLAGASAVFHVGQLSGGIIRHCNQECQSAIWENCSAGGANQTCTATSGTCSNGMAYQSAFWMSKVSQKCVNNVPTNCIEENPPAMISCWTVDFWSMPDCGGQIVCRYEGRIPAPCRFTELNGCGFTGLTPSGGPQRSSASVRKLRALGQETRHIDPA